MLKKILMGAIIGTLISSGVMAKEITFGLQNNESSNLYKGVAAMGEKLKEISNGELTLKIFPSAQLGDFKAMVAQVQAGELGMVMTGYPDMSYIIPQLKLIGAPYAVSNYDHLLKVVKGSFGQKMDKEFEKRGIKVLDVWYQGTRQTTSNKAINSLADMKGLRLRTPNVPFLIAYAKNTGASPAPVAFQEVYLALQTNQVDAEENPLPTIEAMKFYEVQKYIAITNHFIASAAIQISSDLYKGLSEQEQKWLNAAIAVGAKTSNDLTFSDEKNLISKFEGLGLTITRPDLTPFKEAMKPYYKELEAEFGEGSISEIADAK